MERRWNPRWLKSNQSHTPVRPEGHCSLWQKRCPIPLSMLHIEEGLARMLALSTWDPGWWGVLEILKLHAACCPCPALLGIMCEGSYPFPVALILRGQNLCSWGNPKSEHCFRHKSCSAQNFCIFSHSSTNIDCWLCSLYVWHWRMMKRESVHCGSSKPSPEYTNKQTKSRRVQWNISQLKEENEHKVWCRHRRGDLLRLEGTAVGGRFPRTAMFCNNRTRHERAQSFGMV